MPARFSTTRPNRLREGTGPFASNVPTADQRNGLLTFTGFSDLNGNGRFDAGEPTAPAQIDVGGRISPISQAINDGFIPLPNASGVGANYIANGLQRMTEDSCTIRTDSQLTEKDRLTARYAFNFHLLLQRLGARDGR